MGFFYNQKSQVRYGAIIDIGSGSVVGAIVESRTDLAYPKIIWTKREFSPIKKSTDRTFIVKNVLTSLLNVMMSLDSEGRKALLEVAGKDKISDLQVTYSAPWSHTTTRIISYENETDFLITSELIEELLQVAKRQLQQDIKTKESIEKNGLAIVSQCNLQTIANDYEVRVNNKQKAKTLKLVEASSIVDKRFIKNVLDIQSKILCNTKLTQFSSMLTFYSVIKNLYSQEQNICLVNITFEATELGIVRNGVLSYVTYIPVGSFTLTREISQILSVPLTEAHAYLKNENLNSFIESYSENQKKEVFSVIENYKIKAADLFKETGDSLAVPRKIFIHGDLDTEAFFDEHIANAAKANTRLDHAVYNVTNNLLTQNFSSEEKTRIQSLSLDTALLISAQFFHTRDNLLKFEQL